jgi:hypothetical protein
MAPTSISNRSVRIDDAVSIYEPAPSDSSRHIGSTAKGSRNSHYVMSEHPVATTKRTSSRLRKVHHHNHERQQFFLNKLFRTVSPKTPTNSFRRYNSACHEERSHNDESTNGSTSVQHQPPMVMHMTESDGEKDTPSLKLDLNHNHTDDPVINITRTTSTMMMKQPIPQPPPERRKVFIDKLFTVSKMHVNEAGIATAPPQLLTVSSISIDNDKDNHNNKDNSSSTFSEVNTPFTRSGRCRTLARNVFTKSRVIYSIDGDTTTTTSNSVAEDIQDMSSTSTTKSPVTAQASQPVSVDTAPDISPFREQHESPTTTFLMKLPTQQHEIMEIQTDRYMDTSNYEETTKSNSNLIVNPIVFKQASVTTLVGEGETIQTPRLLPRSKVQSFLWQQAAEPQDELPPPISWKKLQLRPQWPKSNTVDINPIRGANPCDCTAPALCATPATAISSSPATNRKRLAWQHYFGTVLDKVTTIQCITNCSDIDLARCGDTEDGNNDDDTEEYRSSSPNRTNRWTRRQAREPVVHQPSDTSNSILMKSEDPSTNSLYTDTEDDSLISASLFDTDTMDDTMDDEEYTYTTYELEEEEDHRSWNQSARFNTPLHLHKFVSGSTHNTSNYAGDDDGTSFSSQNSAWV